MFVRAFIVVLFTSIGLMVFSNLLYGEEVWVFEIVDFDTLNGYPGFVQEMTKNDSLHETDFFFEENGYIRWYAYKVAGQDSFHILPDSTYSTKSDSLEIGDTWNSWMNGPTNAEVVDTATVSVPAGTFFSYVVEHHPQSFPDSVEATFWGSFNVGGVKQVFGDDTLALGDYSLLGGTGYMPLYVGNWWRFEGNTGIEEETDIPYPLGFYLSQNYPNPFNPVTTISYHLPRTGNVLLRVYNVRGQLVETLVNELKPAGDYSFFWNAEGVSSGIYFYCIIAGGFTDVKKCIILK